MNNPTPDDGGWLLDEFDAEHFWSRVNFNGGEAYREDAVVDLERVFGQCWVWVGATDGRSRTHAYGSYTIWGKKHRAHRIAFRDFGNKLDDSQVIDHLCRNTRCVNPRHLEATTQKINMSRSENSFTNRTHCRNGHLLREDTVKHTGKSWRCKVCLRESKHRSSLRSEAA